MANPLLKQRKLEEGDYPLMNLPRAFRNVDLKGVSPECREKVEDWISKTKEIRNRGTSFYLWGAPGVGKSSIGYLLLKSARTWGLTAYAITVAELREAVMTRRSFNPDSTVFDRCNTIDFLLLDDLRFSDASERFFAPKDIRAMIVTRASYGLVTIVTSQQAPSAWDGEASDIKQAIEKSCKVERITGLSRSSNGTTKRDEFLK